MPTFLEVLWANLYSQECARAYAAYAAADLVIATMRAQDRQRIADEAKAFADDMVHRAGGVGTGLAALQAGIVALKGP